jgi:hypothetical protein
LKEPGGVIKFGGGGWLDGDRFDLRSDGGGLLLAARRRGFYGLRFLDKFQFCGSGSLTAASGFLGFCGCFGFGHDRLWLRCLNGHRFGNNRLRFRRFGIGNGVLGRDGGLSGGSFGLGRSNFYDFRRDLGFGDNGCRPLGGR